MTEAQKTFIEQIGNAARKYYPQYKILPSLTIAQAIKESGWNKSQLSSKYFNFFGMKWNTKCGTDYVEMNTKEYKNGQYVTVKAKFRKYSSFEEGIKGYYDFIYSYKRYANLIGETDPETACRKIQADGWATSPTYASSLYKDYIIKYGLTAWDQEASAPAPAPVPAPVSDYVKGRVYTLDVNLYIRKEPNGRKKKPYELTVSGKLNSYADAYGDAVLRAGTRVTCMDVVHDGSYVWLLIPSGFVCAKTPQKVYIR